MSGTRVTIWVVAAVAVVGVATAAVTMADATGARDDVLSQDDVSQELADATAAPAPGATGSPGAPGATGSPAPGTAGQGDPSALRSRAGQLVARCDGATALLDTWSPNPGYRVDDVVRGPAPEVSVWFESDSFEDVEVLVRCEAGEPRMTELVEPDDHGGDRDDDRDDRNDRDDRDDRYDDDRDDDRSGRG